MNIMNKFKLYHPLIMSIFYFILLVFFSYVEFVEKNPKFAIVTIGSFKIHLFMTIIVIGYVAFLAFILIYSYYFQKSNKGNPFSLKPPEINEEDEGTKTIYNMATKRIYIFYSSAVPILLLIAFFLHMFLLQISMVIVIYVLLTILVIHYLIYHKVILEYLR